MHMLTYFLPRILMGGILGLSALLITPAIPQDWRPYDVAIVRSGSMEPTIPTGSVVLFQPRLQYAPGEIIVYSPPADGVLGQTQRRATVHRLVQTQPMRTKGDASAEMDGTPLAPTQVRGAVFAVLPFLGYLLSGFGNPGTALMGIIMPLALAVYHTILVKALG